LNLLDSARKMKSRSLAISGILFIIEAAGFFTVSIFNVDVAHSIASPHGLIHIFAALSIAVIFPVSCLFLSYKLAKHLKHKPLAGITALTGLIGLAAAAWIAFPPNRATWMGLSERLLAGSNIMWLVFAGSRTLKVLKKALIF
jgi:hypothetical protein